MGKEVILDPLVSIKFESLSDEFNPTVGLIIGTIKETGEYCIIHGAETLEGVDIDYRSNDNESSSSSDQESEAPSLIPKSFTKIKTESVAHHAKQVIRMLPGGLFILGFYAVEPVDNIFTTKYEGVIKGILATIKKSLGRNIYYRNDIGIGSGTTKNDFIVLHYNHKNSKFSCKSVETELYKTQQLETSVKKLEWVKLECEHDSMFAMHLNKADLGLPLKKNLRTLMDTFQKRLEIAEIFINGSVPTVHEVYEEQVPLRLDSDTESGIGLGDMDSDDGGVDNSPSPNNSPRHGSDSGDSDNEIFVYKPCAVHILVDKAPGLIRSSVPGEDFVSHLHLQGKLACVAFGIKGCSTAHIAKMVRTDILRSLASRLEMHCESLVEEEQLTETDDGLAKVYHEVPRRVFTKIPLTQVLVSDYLFPGEGPKESVNSFRDILNLDLEDELAIIMTKEKPFNLDELRSKGSLEELMSAVDAAATVTENVDRQKILFWLVCIGILVAFVGVIMPVLNSKLHES